MAVYQAAEIVTEDFEQAARRVSVRVHRASTPIEADLILPPPSGLSPGVASVIVIDPTHIRVNFERAAIDNQALRSPGSYKITPTLTVFSVVPEVVTNPTYVILTISEQRTGQNYLLELVRIEAA